MDPRVSGTVVTCCGARVPHLVNCRKCERSRLWPPLHWPRSSSAAWQVQRPNPRVRAWILARLEARRVANACPLVAARAFARRPVHTVPLMQKARAPVCRLPRTRRHLNQRMTRAHRDWGGLPDDKKSGYRELGPSALFCFAVGLAPPFSQWRWLNGALVVFSNPPIAPGCRPQRRGSCDRLVRLPPSILGNICLVAGLRIRYRH